MKKVKNQFRFILLLSMVSIQYAAAQLTNSNENSAHVRKFSGQLGLGDDGLKLGMSQGNAFTNYSTIAKSMIPVGATNFKTSSELTPLNKKSNFSIDSLPEGR